MINDILFINEEYYKKVITHTRGVDNVQLQSAVRLIQSSDLISVITRSIYERFQTRLKAGTGWTDDEDALYSDIQLYLACKAALEITYSSPTKAQDDIRETASLAYISKAALIEARMVRSIKASSELSSLAASDAEGFDDNEFDVQGGFYFG